MCVRVRMRVFDNASLACAACAQPFVPTDAKRAASKTATVTTTMVAAQAVATPVLVKPQLKPWNLLLKPPAQHPQQLAKR